ATSATGAPSRPPTTTSTRASPPATGSTSTRTGTSGASSGSRERRPPRPRRTPPPAIFRRFSAPAPRRSYNHRIRPAPRGTDGRLRREESHATFRGGRRLGRRRDAGRHGGDALPGL